jgi:hypothetical protein
LRKYIRKLLKLLIKDNIFKSKNIDVQKYNSDILYKMIKNSKISYEMLTKEVLLDVILKAESNCKMKLSILNKNLKKKKGSMNDIPVVEKTSYFGKKRSNLIYYFRKYKL